MTEINGEIDENSNTLNFIHGDPGLLILDPLQDCTQGSQSCISRNDHMHDSTLHGVKKRKVTTPVVKPGLNKRMKPVEPTYPSVAPFLRTNKSPEGSPAYRHTSEENVSSQESEERAQVIEASVSALEEDGPPPSMTPLVVQSSRRERGIDPDEYLRLRGEVIELEQKLCFSQDELQLERERWHKIAEDFSSKLMRASKTITTLLEEQARREFIEVRKRLVADQERLGRFVSVPTQPNGNRGGFWDGGTEDECINASLLQLEQDRADLDREKLASRKIKKAANLTVWSNSNSNSTARDAISCSKDHVTMLADNLSSSAYQPVLANSEVEHLLVDTKESIALAEALFRRTDEALRERHKKLHADRIAYMKQLKTYRAQEDSTFNSYRRLGPMDRYQLLNMLGKGGFSEVYKAYDLIAHCYVAVKIHEIRKDMDEAQRQNYVKHTTQEYRIHKNLKHRRIVRLLDHFAIDALSFGVTMEYCEGVDLDTYLKAHGPMTEKEARGVIIQILSALRYMNTPPNKVIHYDLKPGNILYHKGNVKIVDFGLSKIVDHTVTGGHDTIELTSQGAGTYYYLPPECFNACSVVNPGQLKVSNKVDVWSVGVVFFELLFGRKPFGDGQSQEHILRQASAIFNPTAEVAFPGKISKQAEEFIRRLLTYDVRKRPDVIEASDDPYVFPAAATIASGRM